MTQMPQAQRVNKNNCMTKNAKVRSRKRPKALSTKERLISNARQVFSKSPYKTASLRNISSSHNLVWYHFGSKANLFNALTSRIAEEVSSMIPSFVQGMDKMPPQKGLSYFVKKLLDYLFTHPESMQIINQNLGNCDESDIGYPGLDIMQAMHNQFFNAFRKILPKNSSKKDLERWCLVFLIYIINFIGAMRANQIALNLKPYRHVYQEWVEDFIVFILFPTYNHLAAGPEAKEFEDMGIQLPGKANKPKVLISDKDEGVTKVDPKSKGDVTREKILNAARMVFAKHPFDAASLRMIGKEGNIFFPSAQIWDMNGVHV